MSKYQTKIDGRGPNGNIFAILGQARTFMRQLSEPKEEIDNLLKRVTESGSYEEAIAVIEEYFPVELD